MGYEIQPLTPLAVVGMDVAWGGCDNLDAFERMVYEAGAFPAALQPALLEGEKRAVMLPAPDTLLAKVTRCALRDAGFDPAALKSSRIMLLLAGGQPGSQNWIWASSFSDLSDQPNPLWSAVVQASHALGFGQCDAVVFSAGNSLASLPSEVPLNQERTGLGFDRDVHGWRLGEGAGAIVLMKYDTARQEGRKTYAVIRSAAASGQAGPQGNGLSAAQLPTAPVLQDIRGCCQAALEAAQVSAGRIGYLEVFASGHDAVDGIEIAGIAQAYRQPEQDLTTALGSVQAHIGYLGAAAGLAGLIRTALCLYHRFIPGAPGWTAPKLPALWRGAPFYVPAESRPWFEKNADLGRLAGFNVIGLGGSFSHLILSEGPDKPARTNRALALGGFSLFPLSGDDLDDLVSQLGGLRKALLYAVDIPKLAAEYYENSTNSGDATYSLAIVGHNYDEIQREIEMALNALPAAFEKNVEWQTPLGSYFTPQPVGHLGGVALVYPGAFNSYVGVGKDLFHLFPSLYRRVDVLTRDHGRVFRERLLYPRSLTAYSKDDLATLEAKLIGDPIAMLMSGTSLSVLYTHILQDYFAIHPQAVFGYSLGENSMLFATQVWGNGDASARYLEESPTFRVRLAGPQLAIREYWGLGPMEQDSPAQRLWANYLVMTTPEKIQTALQNESRVYLTHINTPRQVVIGGDPEACQRVLAGLRCSALQAPFDYALHCEAMRSEYASLTQQSNWPIDQVPDLRLYSAADYGPIGFDQTEISNKIAHMLTTTLDFPRLIQRVYADGARVFVEVGAGSNCARWIDETLKGDPHLAISMNRRGTDDYHTLVRTLARLFSHRVSLDLTVLYQPEGVKVST